MKTPMDALLNAVEWQKVEQSEYIGIADDLPWVTHSGILNIGSASFRCYQLSDGTRILDAEDVEEFFGLCISEGSK